MKRLFAALLVAALCLAVPAIAQSMDDIPAEAMVYIDSDYPPGYVMGTYFDVYFCDHVCGVRCVDCCNWEPVGDPYAGWCVDTTANSIKDLCYCGEFSSTVGESAMWNQVNWILNNKGDLSFGEIQAAIWMVMGQTNYLHKDWDTAAAEACAEAADPEFIPGCGDIMAVLVEPCEDDGQLIIIEVAIPPCPPVPEFPVMTIPLFFIGGVLVAASVLRKE